MLDGLLLCAESRSRTRGFYGGDLAAKLMPSIVDEMSRNQELAALVRDDYLHGRRVALRVVFERGIERGDLCRDVDLEFALDVLAGALFFRLLVTADPLDEALAQAVVGLILRGLAPVTCSYPSQLGCLLGA